MNCEAIQTLKQVQAGLYVAIVIIMITGCRFNLPDNQGTSADSSIIPAANKTNLPDSCERFNISPSGKTVFEATGSNVNTVTIGKKEQALEDLNFIVKAFNKENIKTDDIKIAAVATTYRITHKNYEADSLQMIVYKIKLLTEGNTLDSLMNKINGSGLYKTTLSSEMPVTLYYYTDSAAARQLYIFSHYGFGKPAFDIRLGMRCILQHN